MLDEDQDYEEVSPFLAPTSTSSTKRKKPISIGDYFAPRTKPESQPSIKSGLVGKETKWRVDMAVARLFYDSCISINVINSIYFQPVVDAITAIGPGYKLSTYHSLRVNLLRDAKKEVQLLVDGYKKTWKDVGLDVFDVEKDAGTLFNLFEEIALWVGPNNIVHLVTNNGENYKVVGRMLCEKYNSITWSPYATHCINLMLKDIVEMNHIVNLSRCASEVTKFVYNHSFVLALLRKNQAWTKIIRPSTTRFATTFIALSSLHQDKHDLQSTVTNKAFVESQYAKTKKGKTFISIILDNRFWDDVGIISKVVGPLMYMLRIVDSDKRSSIGYVYDDMYRTRMWIKKLFKN
ncbi:uncharacterized protein LOC116116792 [Pistacia vera]|uniref:uncharacterized protein LOC116116792 n=1 Tax=Pistacia vera TaxID=55513 RepID=UPI00126335DD|nr:uncharacterized protein LOC116116792 [Pistacia vera]